MDYIALNTEESAITAMYFRIVVQLFFMFHFGTVEYGLK